MEKSHSIELYVENIDDCMEMISTIDEHTRIIELWGEQCRSDDVFSAVASALNTYPSILSLHVFIDTLDPVQMAILSQSLKLNTSITFVCIACDQLSDDTIHDLANVIQVNSSIQFLRIRQRCRNGDDIDMRPLFSTLVQNTTLLELDMDSFDNIRHDAMVALSRALCLNTSLGILRVCKKKHDGLLELMNALCMNSTITDLAIGCGRFGTDHISIVRSMANVISINTSIQHMSLWSLCCKALLESEMIILITPLAFNSSITSVCLPSHHASLSEYWRRSINSSLCEIVFTDDHDDDDGGGVDMQWIQPAPTEADLALDACLQNHSQSTASVQCVLSEYMTQHY